MSWEALTTREKFWFLFPFPIVLLCILGKLEGIKHMVLIITIIPNTKETNVKGNLQYEYLEASFFFSLYIQAFFFYSENQVLKKWFLSYIFIATPNII